MLMWVLDQGSPTCHSSNPNPKNSTMSKEALTGHKPANTRRPFIAFAHEAGRFYSDPVVEVLTKARDRKKNRLNIMFCRNVKETIHLLASSDIMGTPDVLFIDGRIPNDGFYQDRSPGDTLFYTGTKVYNDVRRENRNLRIVIFTTDHSEATRL